MENIHTEGNEVVLANVSEVPKDSFSFRGRPSNPLTHEMVNQLFGIVFRHSAPGTSARGVGGDAEESREEDRTTTSQVWIAAARKKRESRSNLSSDAHQNVARKNMHRL